MGKKKEILGGFDICTSDYSGYTLVSKPIKLPAPGTPTMPKTKDTVSETSDEDVQWMPWHAPKKNKHDGGIKLTEINCEVVCKLQF